ncbi:mRNA 3'-end-processing protein rna14, partial [Cladochytrium tenue]
MTATTPPPTQPPVAASDVAVADVVVAATSPAPPAAPPTGPIGTTGTTTTATLPSGTTHLGAASVDAVPAPSPAADPAATPSNAAWNPLPEAPARVKSQDSKADRLERLHQKVERDPWNLDGWGAYLLEATSRSDPKHARAAYDEYLDRFPGSTKHWIKYIEFEQRLKSTERVEELFNRCLRKSVSVDLWRFYLGYVRRTHSPSSAEPEKKAECRQIITQAFEVVLSSVGTDKDAGSIWGDYLAFLKSAELDTWKRYIAWEKANPLRVSDNNVLAGRVMYAYKAALEMLRFFPEIWYSAAQYLLELGKSEDAISFLAEAVIIMPRSLLLSFALAEAKEAAKQPYPEIAAVLEQLISSLESGIAETNTRFDAERQKMLERLQGATASGATAGAPDATEWDGEMRERERERQRQIDAEVDAKVEGARRTELAAARQACSLSWVVFIRIARRCQGVKMARNVFKAARKSPHIGYQVYVAADARALFERALVALNPERAQSIWTLFMRHELNYGELSNITKAEKRRREMLKMDVVREIMDRWTYLDIKTVVEKDLGQALNDSQDDPSSTSMTRTRPPAAPNGRTTTIPGTPAGLNLTGSTGVGGGLEFKAQSLESVHPERYPRPDFARWTPFRPEPAAGRAGGPPPIGSGGGGGPPPGAMDKPPGPPARPPTAVVMVPDQVAKLMEVLPPPSTYN